MYEGAKISQIRKEVETFESKTLHYLRQEFVEDSFPIDPKILSSSKETTERELIDQFSKDSFNHIPFHEGFEFFRMASVNFTEFYENMALLNDQHSQELSQTMVNAMLDQLTTINEIDTSGFKNPALFHDFKSMFEELLSYFFDNIEGSSKYEELAKAVPSFLLNYLEQLHSRVNELKNYEIEDLKENINQQQFQIGHLTDKLELQENSYIEAEKMRAESSTQSDNQGLEINRLKMKNDYDKRLFLEKIEGLEEVIETKDSELTQLRREVDTLKSNLKQAEKSNSEKTEKITNISKQLKTADKKRKILTTARTMHFDDFSGAMGGYGDLREVWETISEVKDNMDKFTTEIKEGFSSRSQVLSESMIEKDNQVFAIIQKSEKEKRNLKSKYKKIIKSLKDNQEQEMDSLYLTLNQEKRKLVDLKKSILQLEAEKTHLLKFEETVETLKELIETLKKDKNAKEDLISIEREIINNFVIEFKNKEKEVRDLRYSLRKKEQLVKGVEERVKKNGVTFQQLLLCTRNKKNIFKSAWVDLSVVDQKMITELLKEPKINLSKYL